MKFAVYGTLKAGHGNHRYLLNNPNVKFLGEHNTEPAYTMVSRGGYPGVYCEGNTSIKTEIYETEDKEVIDGVFGLEGYSGVPGNPHNWYDLKTIATPYGEAGMFVFHRPADYQGRPIVESGNW